MDVESWCVCVYVPSRFYIDHTWYWDEWRETPVFISFFTDFVHGHGHGLGHDHGHGHGLGVVVVGQRFGWRCGAPKVVLPLRRQW